MRRLLQAVLAAVCCTTLGAGTGFAQRHRLREPVAARPQPVTVWVVVPGTDADRHRIARQKAIKQMQAGQALPTTVQEQTAGSFGRASSDAGQTAGSYGQTSSSSGTNASDTGQTAGSYGTTAGSFGTAASNHGQTAGSVGQTAGSFGETSGGSNSQSPESQSDEQSMQQAQQALQRSIGTGCAGAEPHRYAIVIADELRDKLTAAEGSAAYPDVLLDGAFPAWWDGSGLGLTLLGRPSFLEVAEAQPNSSPLLAAIMVKAPHPAEARTFVEHLRTVMENGFSCDVAKLEKQLEEPARTAASAVDQVLQGSSLGEMADPEAAKFSAEVARKLALGSFPPEVLSSLKFQVDVIAAEANERLAVVSLRVAASSPQSFGALNARVILRRADGGRWRVLQITPAVGANSLQNGWDLLRPYTLPGEPARVAGISQAAPPDGDNRPPQPDLWWDNGGGAGLLVVEWQMNTGGGWTDTRLMYVPDRANRAKTRVTASFAVMPGEYRWRVWSMGEGGTMTLSPFRRLIVMP
ncbi:MAG TPA: hypothetical protein VIJ79_17005 [Acidobacteriaceae bacterium]